MPLPPLNEIRFSDDNIDHGAEYQINIIPFETTIEFASTTANFDESKILEIHIYVKSLSEDEPEEVGEIQKEIERILIENPSALVGEGISLVQILDFRQMFDGDNAKTMWHFVFDVQLFYRKFLIIS